MRSQDVCARMCALHTRNQKTHQHNASADLMSNDGLHTALALLSVLPHSFARHRLRLRGRRRQSNKCHARTRTLIDIPSLSACVCVLPNGVRHPSAQVACSPVCLRTSDVLYKSWSHSATAAAAAATATVDKELSASLVCAHGYTHTHTHANMCVAVAVRRPCG